MTLERKFELILWADWAIAFALPFLILVVAICVRQTLAGSIAAIFFTWIAVHHFSQEVFVPVSVAYYDSIDPESMYDGIGHNAAATLIGWLPPLVTVLSVLLVRYLCRQIYERWLVRFLKPKVAQ